MESASAGTALTQVPKVAVIGAGWAGLAAAITAVQLGQQVTIFEASRHWGGRARSLPAEAPNIAPLDNGQHILIGAYQQTLALLKTVDVAADNVLWRMPLNLKDAAGQGLSLPALPFPFNLLLGIARAKGWQASDKWSLLTTALRWQRMRFECAEALTVRDVCAGLSPRIWQDLIESLCVAALNTPAHQASGAVFLRVLKDAIFGAPGSSDLLLPRVDLGEVFPHAAVRWLENHGASCKLGTRIENLTLNQADAATWQIADQVFNHVIVATPAWDAANLIAPLNHAWAQKASSLAHEAIATVYVQAPVDFKLPQAMMALQSNAQSPAQFVFDRGLMMPKQNTPGLLAFVVSASDDTKQDLETKVMRQARELLSALHANHKAINTKFQEQVHEQSLQLVQTVIEKRATFACTPALERPTAHAFKGLTVCGDYVAGPYPATLEGAVMSGCQAGHQAASAAH
jgi:squalene-associated FAD-dependent desaturase